MLRPHQFNSLDSVAADEPKLKKAKKHFFSKEPPTSAKTLPLKEKKMKPIGISRFFQNLLLICHRYPQIERNKSKFGQYHSQLWAQPYLKLSYQYCWGGTKLGSRADGKHLSNICILKSIRKLHLAKTCPTIDTMYVLCVVVRYCCHWMERSLFFFFFFSYLRPRKKFLIPRYPRY